MKGLILLLISIPLLLGTGYWHGLKTSRWQESQDLAVAVARLEQLPSSFGDWKGQAMELKKEVQGIAGISGYYMRRFENAQTQASLQVLLACGLPGPISVHTPDICMPGSGFQGTGTPALFRPGVKGEMLPSEFWTARFSKPFEPGMQIFWAWNAGDGWQAPSNPRLSYSGNSRLFKLYIVQTVSPQDAQNKSCNEFLQVFLPAVEKTLFSGS